LSEKHSLCDERLSNCDNDRGIQGENCNGGASDWSTTGDLSTLPREVISPDLAAWMKQSDQLPRERIESSDIWAFVQVAVLANECEICVLCHAAVLSCNDVIDLVANSNQRLWQTAILAGTV
jgi:hypothetical protein